MKTRILTALAIITAVATGTFSLTRADEPQLIKVGGGPQMLTSAARAVTPMETKSIEYLLSVQDKETGAWTKEAGPAITALVVRALVQNGHSLDDPAVKKGLAFIEKFRKADGGYYEAAWPNYSTSIVLSLFAALPEKDKATYKDKIAAAQTFLRSIQSVEGQFDDKGQPITPEHPWYGGAGYAGKGAKRPDLSNTAFFVEALRDSGVAADDPAIQKAAIFVARCQLNAETNPLPLAKGQTSGGMIYTTNNGGESAFGTEKDREGNEVLVAYGGMTYAGLKSFIYAGLKKDDPRVKQAWKWISNNWTLDVNPGTTSEMGLFYFYHTFAKALQASGEDFVTDAKGVKHDWRKELEAKLGTLQKADGSFVNSAETKAGQRWMEANPQLVTAYVTLALQEARK